ncbi:MAG: DNA-formamidopyrimidine glycosylase family protein [Actinomycetota bacterium]
MPEGDTLYNTALLLGPAFDGRTLAAASFPRLRGMDRLKAGDVVTEVRARGKYLEIEVERGYVLRTHLRMTGTWHLYEPGDRWRKPRHLARAVLETDASVAVCFAAPVVEIGRRGDGALDHLGPDLCRPPVDVDEILRRVDAWANVDAEIGDVLLDQRLAAGIGNVYRCEALFACGVAPARRLGDVDETMRRSLYETAAGQLQANLGRWKRETVRGGLAVYGRDRQGCRVCRGAIRTESSGSQGRVTYWCPTCQR